MEDKDLKIAQLENKIKELEATNEKLREKIRDLYMRNEALYEEFMFKK